MNPYRPHQGQRPEKLAAKTRDPKTSMINARDTWLPKAIHPGVRTYRMTPHQPPKERNNLPMD